MAIEGYDLVMLGILAVAAVLGYFKGMVWQLAWIAGIVASTTVAIRFSGPLAGFFGQQPPWNRLLAMLALYVATSLVVWLVFRVVSGAISAVHLSSFDHQLGLLLGLAKGVLLCIVVTFFAVTLAPGYRDQIVGSRSGRIVAELIVRADEFLEHESFGRADAAVLLGEIGVGAGVAREHRQVAVGPGGVDRAADVAAAEHFGDPLEAGGYPGRRDLRPVGFRQGRTDSADQSRPDGRIPHAADFPPQHERQIPEVVSTEPAAGIGQAVGMGRAAARLRDRRPLDQAGLHQPIQPLADRRGGDAERFGQLTDSQCIAKPEQIDDRRVTGAGFR